MEQQKYLERLKLDFTGKIEPTVEVLLILQKAHLLNIPFENLDIHYNKIIDLKNTFDKIIVNGRGGFCYELNGLFFELLKSIGFNVKLISARGFDNYKGFGPEFDHMAILATINSIKFLVDVGFGEFTLHPLSIELNKLQSDPRGNFIIEEYEENYLIVKKENSSNFTFTPEYIFTETERELNDFNEMCNYHQFDSNSHFTRKKLCTLPTLNGRITVTGTILKIKNNDEVIESEIKNDAELNKILMKYFNISL
jgi:N-hydroxyarylamine O-acetyltransferase